MSLTPLESPTVKNSPRCWHWTVSHPYLLTGILALRLQAFVSWPFKRILSVLILISVFYICLVLQVLVFIPANFTIVL